MKLLIVFLSALVLINASYTATRSSFLQWSKEHNKFHNEPEIFEERYQIWKENLQFIQQHNLLYQQGQTTFTVAMNKFGDLTAQEFADLHFTVPSTQGKDSYEKYTDLPASFDWRTKGVVSGVEDQGRCASAFIFSEADAVASSYAINTGKLLSPNYNQLAVCSGGPTPCEGGFIGDLFKYVTKCGMLSGKNGDLDQCTYDKDGAYPAINGVKKVIKGNETDLAVSLYTVGPVSVGIDASRSSFQFYSGGVYYDAGCTNDVDHTLLAVGFGTAGGSKYWICKNSWGTNWGLNGYIQMSRDRNNNCGIASYASYPIYGTSSFNPDASCRGN